MPRCDREALQTFVAESATRLPRITRDLTLLAAGRPLPMEIVHRIFRETHSLKGAANLLGLTPLEQLAHKLEDILELLRNGGTQLDQQLIELLHHGYTRIEQLLDNLHLIQVVDVSRDLETIERCLSARRK
jgi:chemotaxis protein histidine kinase CheA